MSVPSWVETWQRLAWYDSYRTHNKFPPHERLAWSYWWQTALHNLGQVLRDLSLVHRAYETGHRHGMADCGRTLGR